MIISDTRVYTKVSIFNEHTTVCDTHMKKFNTKTRTIRYNTSSETHYRDCLPVNFMT